MLFRIEDRSPNAHTGKRDSNPHFELTEKCKIDECIARLIRDELNNTQDKVIRSYSKSLAACLLNFNMLTDNELHIWDTKRNINFIQFQNAEKRCVKKAYYIKDQITKCFSKSNEKVKLLNFVIDISNNEIVREYLTKYSGKAFKARVSPQKYQEVVVMNLKLDERYYILDQIKLESVYTLYALQIRYRFLSEEERVENILVDLRRFLKCRKISLSEYKAYETIIWYLHLNWEYEFSISEIIYKDFKKDVHPTTYCDPILRFARIQENNLQDAYDYVYECDEKWSDLSKLFLRHCAPSLQI